jgi:acetyl-CoA acetyltransferase
VFNKAALDKKTPSLLARLARQVAVMYEEAKYALGLPALAAHFDKSWAAHAAMKASLYDVEALRQAGAQARADQKVSTEVAVLREAFKRVQVGCCGLLGLGLMAPPALALPGVTRCPALGPGRAAAPRACCCA